MSISSFKRLARAKALQQARARTGTALIHHIVHTASPRFARTTMASKHDQIIIPPDNEPPEVRAAEIERRLQALGIEYVLERHPNGVPSHFHYVVGAEALGPDKRVDRLLFAWGLDPVTSIDED